MRIFKHVIILISLILITNNFSAKDLKFNIIDKDINIPLEGVSILVSGYDTVFSDQEGNAVIRVDDSLETAIIHFSLIGYEIEKKRIKEFGNIVKIEMSIAGSIEGEEIVIEENYYKKEDKLGTSIVVDKEELKSLAMRDRMEDVFNGVKTMPGVSYSANFHTNLSVRGGDGSEIASSYDGFLIRNPFYWGQSYSIYDPNIVESAKFNNGVFDVSYGMAMSGLLEVDTMMPDEGFKFTGKESLSSIHAYTQIPFGKSRKSGMLAGGRVTMLDIIMGPIWTAQGLNVQRAPYIYDAHLKWFFTPNDKFKWFIQGFYGADGIAMNSLSYASEGINIDQFFTNENYHAIGFSRFEIIPNEIFFIKILTGYEFQNSNNTFTGSEEGAKDYSTEFKNSPDYNISYGDSFDIKLNSDGYSYNTLHSIQSKIDVETALHDRVVLSFGTGLIYDIYNQSNYNKQFNFNLKQDVIIEQDLGYSHGLNSNLYLNFDFYPIPDKLEIKLGCRVDHFAGFYESSSLNTYPAVNPRFYIAYTPIRNKGIEYLTFSLGVGLYSKMPQYINDADDPLTDFSLSQEKVLNNVIGMEVMLPYGFKIKLEGYYKYYFHRNYATRELGSDDKFDYNQYSDGLGHAAGFDVIVKRKISRYIDGWLSYSFIYARYYNPHTDGQDFSLSGDPVGYWHYPTYHRWHSFNIVLNIKPTNWMTISPSFGIHSGLPKGSYGSKDMYSSTKDGEVLELYTRDYKYSDTDRTLPSFPLSIKVDFHFYFPKTQVRFETYVALDNITALWWRPDIGQVVDNYTGEVVDQSPLAYETFMPSFGIKISY